MHTDTFDLEQISQASELVDNYMDRVMKAMIRFGEWRC